MSEKIKYELEFVIKASANMLYKYISTPSGLSEWFADNVNLRGEFFTFIWDGEEERARLLTKKLNQFVKFKWEADEEKDTYFELRIQIDDLTKDVALMVTDFAEEDELEEEFTDVIKKMSQSSGRVLVKLIDRETGESSYEIIKEMRGGFKAFIYQGVGKLYGADLKVRYNPKENEEDEMIERIVQMINAGKT